MIIISLSPCADKRKKARFIEKHSLICKRRSNHTHKGCQKKERNAKTPTKRAKKPVLGQVAMRMGESPTKSPNSTLEFGIRNDRSCSLYGQRLCCRIPSRQPKLLSTPVRNGATSSKHNRRTNVEPPYFQRPTYSLSQPLNTQIPGLEDSMAIHSAKTAFMGNPFYYSLAIDKPKTIADLVVDKFVKKEKAYFAKKGQRFPVDNKEESNKRKDDSQRGEDWKRERRGPSSSKFPSYTTLF
ncbi:uncharacterized protein G2W53_015394 [Senna tora]|uniref:Uncharacterized protein n=1 Tax=Senna tora TaxID=362788 RepID=A0A834WV52_9FABA|nr:uncharacterized protein G2W53_015394 [Senna tora]